MEHGLGKITDYVRERFDGKDPDKYNEFINQFETGVFTLDIPIHKQCYVLMSLLERTPKNVCSTFIENYKALHPNVVSPHASTRASANAEMMADLKTHLASHPSVVGTRPADHLLELWMQLTQGDHETVRAYFDRFEELKRRLNELQPPITFNPKLLLKAFKGQTMATGLLPPIQDHVELHGADKIEGEGGALEAAENFEWVNKDRVIRKRRSTTLNWVGVASSDSSSTPTPRWVTYHDDDLDPDPDPDLDLDVNGTRSPLAGLPDAPPINKRAAVRAIDSDTIQQQSGIPPWRRATPARQMHEHYGDDDEYEASSYAPPPFLRLSAQGREQGTQRYQPQGATRTMTEPGSKPEICIHFLRNQQCRYGNRCSRLHLVTLDATRDVRPYVKLRPTPEMKADIWRNGTDAHKQNHASFDGEPATVAPPPVPIDLGVCTVDVTAALSEAQINSKHAESLALAQHSVMANMDGHEGTPTTARTSDNEEHVKDSAHSPDLVHDAASGRMRENYDQAPATAVAAAINNETTTPPPPPIDLDVCFVGGTTFPSEAQLPTKGEPASALDIKQLELELGVSDEGPSSDPQTDAESLALLEEELGLLDESSTTRSTAHSEHSRQRQDPESDSALATNNENLTVNSQIIEPERRRRKAAARRMNLRSRSTSPSTSSSSCDSVEQECFKHSPTRPTLDEFAAGAPDRVAAQTAESPKPLLGQLNRQTAQPADKEHQPKPTQEHPKVEPMDPGHLTPRTRRVTPDEAKTHHGTYGEASADDCAPRSAAAPQWPRPRALAGLSCPHRQQNQDPGPMRTAPTPGSKLEICYQFVRNQRCRFGNHCARLHLASLDATRDIRPFVELRPTSEMKADVWTGETGELRAKKVRLRARFDKMEYAARSLGLVLGALANRMSKGDDQAPLVKVLAVAISNIDPTERSSLVDIARTSPLELAGEIDERQIEDARVLSQLCDNDPGLLHRMASMAYATLIRARESYQLAAQSALAKTIAQTPQWREDMEYVAHSLGLVRDALVSRMNKGDDPALVPALAVAISNIDPAERSTLVHIASTSHLNSVGRIDKHKVEDARVLRQLCDNNPKLLHRMASVANAALMRAQTRHQLAAQRLPAGGSHKRHSSAVRTAPLPGSDSGGDDNDGPGQLDPDARPAKRPRSLTENERPGT